MVCQMLITDIKKDQSKHHGLEYAGGGADGEDTILDGVITRLHSEGKDLKQEGNKLRACQEEERFEQRKH